MSVTLASLAFAVWQHGWNALWKATEISFTTQVVGKWLIFFGAKKENHYLFGPWVHHWQQVHPPAFCALSDN